MRKTRKLGAGVVLVLAATLAACGSDDKSSSSTAAPTSAAAATTAAAAATTAAGGASSSTPAAGSTGTASTAPVPTGLPATIKIGAPLDTSGSAAITTVGADELAGEKLAVDEINESGYLGNTKLDLDFVDTQAAKDVATQTVIAMTTTDKANAIIGFSLTPSFLAAGPVAQAAKIPTIAVGLSGTGVTEVGDYIFRVYPPSVELFKRADPEIVKWLQPKTAAYIYSNDSSNVVEQANTRKSILEGLGVKTVEFQGVKSDAIDYQPQLTAIKAANPDVLVTDLNGGQDATFLAQLKQSGLEVPLMLDSAFGAPNVITDPQLQCATFTTTWDPSITTGRNPDFIKLYQDKNGKPASQYAAYGYDGIWLYATAVRNAGSADPAKVRDALAELTDFPGALGVYSYDENRIPTQEPVIRQVDGGKSIPWDPATACKS